MGKQRSQEDAADRTPVMAKILAEVDAKVSSEDWVRVEAALREAFGPKVFLPGIPAVESESLMPKHNSSTGKLFTPGPGRVFVKIAARLRHPADGSGPADIEVADRVIAKAMELLGTRRMLYGAGGLARPGCHDGYESVWWSPEARARMESVAVMAASGMSWLAA